MARGVRYSDEERRFAADLAASGVPVREVQARTGIPFASVARWQREGWHGGPDPEPPPRVSAAERALVMRRLDRVDAVAVDRTLAAAARLVARSDEDLARRLRRARSLVNERTDLREDV